jgi:hypothetical protein
MPEVDDDRSADTARFRAFAQRQDDDMPAPWRMRAPGSKIGLLAAIVVVVAVLAAIVARLLAG